MSVTIPSAAASPSLDQRVHAYRPDLADAALRDQVTAERYVTPVMRQCLRGVLPLMNRPSPDATQISQIRYGEFFDLFELRDDGFAWVQNRADHYTGYIPATPGIMGETVAMLSNRVTALRTFVYPAPDMKRVPSDELTLGSFISAVGKTESFVELASGGFIAEKHVMATEFAFTPDYVFTAGRLLHTPYLWGGRTPNGIDCSGLVQLALELAGIDAPRDSDQQRAAFAQPLQGHWRDRAWTRGDIVFFNGHVGLMTDTSHMIHANATSMDVTVEPLTTVVERGAAITAVAEAHRIQAY